MISRSRLLSRTCNGVCQSHGGDRKSYLDDTPLCLVLYGRLYENISCFGRLANWKACGRYASKSKSSENIGHAVVPVSSYSS